MPSASSSSRNETFVSTSKNLLKNRNWTFSRSALFHINTRVFLKYFVPDCLWKQFLASNSPQTPLSLICLTILVNLRSLTQFYLKVEPLICKKVLKFILHGTTFPVFSLRFKCGIESLSALVKDVFVER